MQFIVTIDDDLYALSDPEDLRTMIVKRHLSIPNRPIYDAVTVRTLAPEDAAASASEVVDVTTILPWRIVYRGDTTVAAFDHYPTEEEVFAELTALQRTAGHASDELSDLTVTHNTEAI